MSDGVDSVVLEALEVGRGFGRGKQYAQVLCAVSLRVPRGSFVALMGPSGSGKSTFLNCLAGLDRLDAGQVRIGDVALTALDETNLTMFRRDRLGFVFQDYGLIGGLTARQNIELPSRVAERPIDASWVRELATRIGIAELLDRRPAELSGGQQQRVAITRALLGHPDLVFADEPTGALDISTSASVLRLLRDAARDLGQTVIMVTHDPVAASAADVVHFMADGQIIDTQNQPSPQNVAKRMSQLVTGVGAA